MKTLVVASVDAGLLAAHHPAKPEHGAVVGDHAHVGVHLVALAVERNEPLALPAEPRADGAGELVGVIDVQRAAAVIGDVVGDIDQRVDRAEPDRLQPALEPVGGGAVLYPAHQAPGEDRAGIGALLVELKLDRDRIGKAAFDRLHRVLLQLAELGGGEIAGDAAHAEAIRAVRRDGDLDHRIVEAERGGGGAADLGLRDRAR